MIVIALGTKVFLSLKVIHAFITSRLDNLKARPHTSNTERATLATSETEDCIQNIIYDMESGARAFTRLYTGATKSTQINVEPSLGRPSVAASATVSGGIW